MKICIVVLSLIVAQRSEAILDVSGLFGLSFADQNVSRPAGTTTTTTKRTYYSLGALANVKVPGLSFVISPGLYYTVMGANYSDATATAVSNYDLKASYYQVPLFIDYWLIDYFGFGGGAYYAIPAGNVSTEGTTSINGVPATVSSSQSFSDANYKDSDYGLALHVQVKYPLGILLFGTFNGTYFYGLQNVSKTTTEIYNRALILQAGIGIGI